MKKDKKILVPVEGVPVKGVPVEGVLVEWPFDKGVK